jgi:hypothetical protein
MPSQVTRPHRTARDHRVTVDLGLRAVPFVSTTGRSRAQSTSAHRSPAINSSRRRRIEPRLIAPLAFLIAFFAIALEIVYAIGQFFSETVQKIQ